jgi:hypothetical protein
MIVRSIRRSTLNVTATFFCLVLSACSTTRSMSSRNDSPATNVPSQTGTVLALGTTSTKPRSVSTLKVEVAVVTDSQNGQTRSEDGEIAEWEPYESITPSTVSFLAAVTRITCNTGVTGRVFPPAITYTEVQIVVTFEVDATHTFDCPGNRRVLYRVKLSEPIGSRRLFDGSCLQGARLGLRDFGAIETCSQLAQNGFQVPYIPPRGPQ